MKDSPEQQADAPVVESGNGCAEADRDVAGKTGGESEYLLLAAGPRQFTGVQGGDAEAQSTTAIGVVPSLILVPVPVNLLVKSMRSSQQA